MSTQQLPADPSPGSHRYFVLLYTPAARRRAMTTLLALADEIGAEPLAGADHGVVHTRLAWWRHEAERLRQGAPEHPWLRSLQATSSTLFDLLPLVDGAEIDLATRTLSNEPGTHLFRALFVAAARLLADDPADSLEPAARTAIEELGAVVFRLEHDPRDAAALATVDTRLSAVGAQHQPSLAPLLVWLALAASVPRAGSRLRNTLATNFAAWSAARHAARGRFNLS